MKATPPGSFIELVESSPTDGTVPDPRPVSIRLYHGGRLGLATFMNAEPVVKSTFKIIPDTWFYTVLEVAYGSAVPLSLAIYAQNDALVETSAARSTRPAG